MVASGQTYGQPTVCGMQMLAKFQKAAVPCPTFSRERLRRVLRKKAAVILHLHTFTPADLHLHTFTPADLNLHTLTSADLHHLTSADLHLHTLTSADLHLHTHIC